MTGRLICGLDPEQLALAKRRITRRQVPPRVEPPAVAEPPAVVAARILKGVHDAYRAARAEATNTTTADLVVKEGRYRREYWLSRQDRVRWRAVREELRARGIDLPPAPPKPRRRRLWTTTI
jgi:hypothetical protein